MKKLLNDEQSKIVGDFLVNKGLSNKEIEVASLTYHGLSNSEIANIMSVKEKTIKFHLTNVFKKLQVNSRARMIVLALGQALGSLQYFETESETEDVLTEGQQEVIDSVKTEVSAQPKVSDETTNVVTPKGMWS